MMMSVALRKFSVQSKYQKMVFLGQKLDFLIKNVENRNRFLKSPFVVVGLGDGAG